MDGQALEDLYVPLSQRRRELRLDVGVERKPGGRIINDRRRTQVFVAQVRNEGVGFLMPQGSARA
jgi:hypothetical protein